MKNSIRRLPSPPMIVAIIALIAALSSPAVARILISNSSQVATGAITSSDIRNGTIKSNDLRNSAVEFSKISRRAREALAQESTDKNGGAIEVVRGFGPIHGNNDDAEETVATMSGIDPGTYVLIGKTLINFEKTGPGNVSQCFLSANERRDLGKVQVGSLQSTGPATHNMQMTFTFGAAGTAAISCQGLNGRWTASETSIIAIRVPKLSLQHVEG